MANLYNGNGESVCALQNEVDADNALWTQWNSRLSFGMTPASAPVPFAVKGQMFVDGTMIAHNNGSQDKNRWGFHVFEAYAKDNYARMTMLLDKHTAEINGKPSLEYYFYTGSNHHATSYGNTKIGSDVKNHSFLFDRDVMTACGEIDCQFPITLARIAPSTDLDATYQTVAEADAAYEPENASVENSKCLKYIALKNAENGCMFYDTERDKVVVKVAGKWCDLQVSAVPDGTYPGDSGGDSGGSEAVTDDITVSDGVMTIVSVGSEITVSDGVMTIA